MSLIADGLLIATCLTAALYCYVLSRRLRQFSNTEEGVGKQVRDLNLALEETRAALKEAQGGAAAASELLKSEIAEANKVSAELAALSQRPAKVESAPPAEPAPAAVQAPVEAPKPTASAAPTKEAPSGGKLEAVQHVDDTPADDSAQGAEDDDLESMDLEEMLAAAPGEQQLGFLPDSMGTDDADAAEDGTPPAPEEAGPDGAKAGGSEKLMKVERMAL